MLANKARVTGHFIPPAPVRLPDMDPEPLQRFIQRYLDTIGQPAGSDPEAELEGAPMWSPPSPAHAPAPHAARGAATGTGTGAGAVQAARQAASAAGGVVNKAGVVIATPPPLAGRHPWACWSVHRQAPQGMLATEQAG